MSRHFSFIAAAAFALVSFGFSNVAHASDEFPLVIAEVVGAAEPPPCTICHATLAGGTGTVVKPFGRHMRERRLTENDIDSLKNALAAIQGERYDTDGDGIPDYDELKAGTDPNGNLNTDVAPVAYGCARMSPSPSSESQPVIFLTALAAAALLRGRFKRRLPL